MARRPKRDLGHLVFGILNYLVSGIIAVSIILWIAFYLKNQTTNYDSNNCINNIRYSTLALSAYREKNGTFPSGNLTDTDKPPVSWRVAVLPYKAFSTDLKKFYRFDEKWDGPENSKLRILSCSDFHCPLDSGDKTHTSYLTIQGPSTFFPDRGAAKLSEHQEGLANTILVVETHQSGIHWIEPRDLRVEDAVKGLNRPRELSISSNHKYFSGRSQDGAFVSFADGRAQFLNSNIDPKLLRSLLEIDNPDKPKEKYISP